MGAELERRWKVGDLAKATGLTVRTLHHYDDIGLLVPSQRTAAGHRLYAEQDVRRLYRILALRRLGMRLDEITSLLDKDGAGLLETVRRHLEQVGRELARMAAEDQRIRRAPKGSARKMVRPLDAKRALEYRRIDGDNTERLRRILAEDGWPGSSLVGEQGAHHAWLIAQHADHDPAFQREALDLLREAVARSEARPRELAYLTDRVRVNEGREQIFGTQMRPDENGMPIPQPIEDPERLDERRAEVGLEPFDQYLRGFVQQFQGG